MARRGLVPSSCRSGFKLIDPVQIFIFDHYDLECFSMAVLVSLSVVGGVLVASDNRVGGTRCDARRHVNLYIRVDLTGCIIGFVDLQFW